MTAVAVIVAGGSGSRFGGDTPKQYLVLGGRPMLELTLSRFMAASSIRSIVVVVAADRVAALQAELPRHFTKVQQVVAGGATRQDSMACGVMALAVEPDTIVAVHDAARPFIFPETIDACVTAARQHGAAIVALNARDTIKQIDTAHVITKTIPRETIWQAQTPQAFRCELLQRAIKHARETGVQGTDEAALVEALGVPVMVVPGHPWNIKVTTPDDMVLAEAINQRIADA